MVDHAVRKTWELAPSQVKFLNSAWNGIIKDVTATAAKELGVVGGVSSIRCELHKLLLYEPGAHFKMHKD